MSKDHDNPGVMPQAKVAVPLPGIAALLGGAPAALVLDAADNTRGMIAALDGPGAWLTPGVDADEPSAGTARQFLLEVASLKLRAFATICQLASQGGPVFDESHLCASITAQPGAVTPLRWQVVFACETMEETFTGARPTGAPIGAGEAAAALGRVLARLLWTTDDRDGGSAIDLADGMAATFDKGLEQAPGTPEEWARNLFARSATGGAEQLLHQAHMRQALAGPALPTGTWLSIGWLLLRLLSKSSQVSFEQQPLTAVHTEVTRLQRHVDVAAFGHKARQDEIAALLRDTLQQRKDQQS